MPQTQARSTAAAAPAPDATVPYDLIELLFFAYRDFVGGPDLILAEYGFGRAHHRVLHFVDRHPGLTIAELLDILRITKQSLNRVLKELIEQGYIAQRTGTSDRRHRLLTCTPEGRQLARRLAGAYDVLYTGTHGRVAHECIIDARPLMKSAGVSVEDIAKRLARAPAHSAALLIDYGEDFTQEDSLRAFLNHRQVHALSQPGVADVTADLSTAMRINPHLRVLSLNGYYDMATPFFSTERDLKHMMLEPAQQRHRWLEKPAFPPFHRRNSRYRGRSRRFGTSRSTARVDA